MKTILFAAVFTLAVTALYAQPKNGNLVIVTLDGFRWQEMFGGMDDSLLNNKAFTSDSAELWKRYGGATAEERRKKLLPFFWTTIASQGQLHGNRWQGSKADVKNRYRFSYPGYNEIFTGYPDTLVNSNDKVDNPNVTVLEFLNRQPSLKGRVAAFTSWDVFDAILNEQRSGIPVSAGFDEVKLATPEMNLLNEMQRHSFQPFDEGIRPDMLTYFIAKEYLKAKKPKVLYIAFDETDDYAHAGRYDMYLNAAHLADQYLQDLWSWLQATPAYRDNTTLIVACDHGRGDAVKKEWTSHGAGISGGGQIWMAFLGKDIPAKGEVKEAEQWYQAQLAQTIAALLGYRFTAGHPIEQQLPFVAPVR